MYTSLLDGTVKRGEVLKMKRNPILRRESLTFGIPEGSILTFLEERGFNEIHNADHRTLHDLYFTGKNANRKVAYGYAIVSARVPIT
jgi:O-methyltransferase involved in polyketide biosynthesis